METFVPIDSFSQLHSYSYSIIALQELNLNYFYPPVYWNCACLTVESQSDEDNDKGGNTNYGKVAKSIYKMKKYGTDVLPPSINNSEISFTPIEKNNTILFGSGGISGINQEIAQEIIDGRPYTSFKQFYDFFKTKENTLITKPKFITLIKAGCFDEFSTNRINLMKWLCYYETEQKTSLTTANLPKAIEMGAKLPKDLIIAYKFSKYVISKKNFYCQDSNFKSKKHYIVDAKAKPFFEKHYISEMQEDVGYYYDNDMLIVVDKALEKAMKKDMDVLKEALNEQKTIDDYNKKLLQTNYREMVETDDVNKWSMEAVSFYANGGHELENINYDEYNISHFSDLPKEPIFVEKSWGKRTWKQYDISRICGTILDRNDNNHLVDILTPDNDVVNIKFNGGQYAYYKQTISEVVDGKKKVLDENWFKKGTLLCVTGYRRGEDAFVAKKYKNSIFDHCVMKIISVNADNSLNLQMERYGQTEE